MERESFENEADRRAAEPRLRADQSGSRRAARCRPHLHDLRAGHHRRRRLADVGLAHAGSAAVLRRHVFPARQPLRPSRLRLDPDADRRGLARPIARRSSNRRAMWSSSCRSRRRSAPGARRPGFDTAVLETRLLRLPPHLRFAHRRLRRRAQISAPVGSSISCCATMRAPRTRKRSTWCC